ncbi:tRNA(Met) cytidine acetyltransferase TmcA [Colwelliaceae bacterium 6471]
MVHQAFNIWLSSYQVNASRLKQRRLVILAGDTAWAMQLLKSLDSFPHQNNASQITREKVWYFFSDTGNRLATINSQNYRNMLGTESDYLVFFDNDINIDSLAALSGTLVAGGVLFVIWPNAAEDSSQSTSSPYYQRLFNQFFNSENVDVIEQGKPLPSVPTELILNSDNQTFPLGCASEGQHHAVQAVIKVARGHRNRPLVLTADRGRGKSSALAIACQQLLLTVEQKQHVLVSAPHVQCLDIFFQQLKQCLPDAHFQNQCLHHENGTVEFVAIDRLIKDKPSATLVLIDEAAAVPVYLLTQLMKQYSRIAFSSTQHGYEGAGRGFTLKFTQVLNLHAPQWQLLHINEPIRWAADDPLEQFIFDTCLLNAQLPTMLDKEQCFVFNELDFEVYKASELIQDERLLSQLFAVLVTAHYQTSPSDLKLILENQNISIVSLKTQDNIVAVALLMKEGQCDEDEIRAVKNNERRLRDQFIPQSLLTHCGITSAFDYRYCRIMRIAVHPQLQSTGIGSRFLAEIEAYAQREYFDFIGSSFGLSQALLNFWLQADFNVARVGFKQDNASGEYSVMVLKHLNSKSEVLSNEITHAFYRTFDYLLTDEYQSLSAKVIWQILHAMPKTYLSELTDMDQNSVDDFVSHQRLYSACVYGLHQWLLRQMHKPFSASILPLITRILQKKSVAQTCDIYALTGKKALNEHLIQFISQCKK